MPGYKGHLVGGVIAFCVTYVAIKAINPLLVADSKDFFIGLGVCLFGSLFPDIDIKSKGQKIFYYTLLPIVLLAIATKQFPLLAVMSVIVVTPVLVSHRGLIHQWWFVLSVPLVVPLFISYRHPELVTPAFLSYAYFISGALSHLLLDYGLWNFFKRVLLRR